MNLLEWGRLLCDAPGASHEELQAGAARRLNVGSGDYPLAYWTNLDADPNAPGEIHATVPPLPLPDGGLDRIWACHFLEHLDRPQAMEFLRECYRCLAPAGECGIVVPDIRAVMRVYLDRVPIRVEYPAGTWHDCANLDEVCQLFLYSTCQASPHRWAWDEETLGRAMTEAGFVDLEPIDRYTDPRLGTGQWYQCGYWGMKPWAT